MRVKRIYAVTLALLVSFALLTACASPQSSGPKQDEKITLNFLRLGSADIVNPIFNPLINEYETKNPNITINVSNMGFDAAATKIPLMASSNTLPDVFFTTVNFGYQLAKDGKLVSLDQYMNQDQKLKDDLYPSIWNGIQYQDKHYWIPSGIGSYQLWYNVDLFKRAGLDPNAPPKTFDELIADAKQITQKTGVPGLGMYASASDDMTSLYQSIYQSYSGQPMWDAKKGDLSFAEATNYPAAMQSIQLLSDLVNKYKVTQSNVVEYNRDSLRPLFRDGKVAMVLDGIWIKARVQQQIDAGTIKPAPFPAGPGGSHPLIGTDGWAIATNSKHPEAAWKFIQFLMTTQNQSRHDSMYGLTPPLKSELQMQMYQTDFWKTVMAPVPDSFGRIANENVTPMEKLIAEQVQAAILNKENPKQAVDTILNKVPSAK